MDGPNPTTSVNAAVGNSLRNSSGQHQHDGNTLLNSLTDHLHQWDMLRTKGAVTVQLVRSCTDWSQGIPTDNSVCNAYIEIIQKSKHFVYIENQFFITATGNKQNPVQNQIGAALVERIVRAHKEQ